MKFTSIFLFFFYLTPTLNGQVITKKNYNDSSYYLLNQIKNIIEAGKDSNAIKSSNLISLNGDTNYVLNKYLNKNKVGNKLDFLNQILFLESKTIQTFNEESIKLYCDKILSNKTDFNKLKDGFKIFSIIERDTTVENIEEVNRLFNWWIWNYQYDLNGRGLDSNQNKFSNDRILVCFKTMKKVVENFPTNYKSLYEKFENNILDRLFDDLRILTIYTNGTYSNLLGANKNRKLVIPNKIFIRVVEKFNKEYDFKNIFKNDDITGEKFRFYMEKFNMDLNSFFKKEISLKSK
jgi:hypothetical protein